MTAAIPPPHATAYGVSISATRWDRLDIKCVRAAARSQRAAAAPLHAVDLGCGRGDMAVTLEAIGLNVIANDLKITPLLRNNPNLRDIAGDAAQIDWLQYPAPDIIYSQRCLHYWPFPQARELLATLSRKPGSAVFISLAGYHSALSQGYPAASFPVERRFAKLAPEVARQYHIKEPLCLYTPDEGRQLFADAGLTVRDLWQSDSGNLKIIAARPV